MVIPPTPPCAQAPATPDALVVQDRSGECCYLCELLSILLVPELFDGGSIEKPAIGKENGVSAIPDRKPQRRAPVPDLVESERFIQHVQNGIRRTFVQNQYSTGTFGLRARVICQVTLYL